jgi:hypothetical protein
MMTNKKMVNKKVVATQALPIFFICFFFEGYWSSDQNSTSCVLVLFSSRWDESRRLQAQ